MTASSATAGHPASPSSPESRDSFIWEPSVRAGSWLCWAMTPPNPFTYSRARRMSTGSDTHLPSSEKTRTRARERAMALRAARRAPPSPSVTAPTGRTWTQPASSPRRRTWSTTEAVSATGLVFAMAWTAV